MFLHKLFKRSSYADSCRDLVIPQCCTIRLWFSDTLAIQEPGGHREDLEAYTHFEVQITPSYMIGNTFPDDFPTLAKEYWFYSFLKKNEHYYKLVPREILEGFIMDLMRANNMCPGPWMTREEKEASNAPKQAIQE